MKWEKKKLINLIELQRGFDITKAEQSDGIVPIISSSGISSFHNCPKCKGPGVVTGRKGTLGKVFFTNTDYWPHDTTLWVKDFKGNSLKYAYYFLHLLKLETYNVGASNPTLNRNHIHKLSILLPPLPIQKKIAAILSAYDDLIENNKRRIAILEKMAEELYREWFVRLRFPGHEGVKIEKGVPEGWEVKRIGEVFDFLEGPGIRNWQYTTQGIPFINIRLINDGEVDTRNANFISESEAFGKYRHFLLNSKDYVLSTSGSIGRGAIIQDYNLPLCLNTSVIRFKSLDEKTYSYMYGYLKSQSFLANVEMLACGSAQLNFGPTHLNSMSIIVPTKKIITFYCMAIDPIYKKLTCLRIIQRGLTTTRDRLLSRLMSGKIDVEELDIKFPPSTEEEEAHA